jgi:hypothetical protein
MLDPDHRLFGGEGNDVEVLEVYTGGLGVHPDHSLDGEVEGPVGVHTGGQQLVAEGRHNARVSGSGVGHLLGALESQGRPGGGGRGKQAHGGLEDGEGSEEAEVWSGVRGSRRGWWRLEREL